MGDSNDLFHSAMVRIKYMNIWKIQVLKILAQNNNYCCCCYIYKFMKEDSLTGIFLFLAQKVSLFDQTPSVASRLIWSQSPCLDLLDPHQSNHPYLYSSDLISY